MKLAERIFFRFYTVGYGEKTFTLYYYDPKTGEHNNHHDLSNLLL